MKKNIILLLLALSSISKAHNIVDLDDVRLIKNAKLIIALTDNKEFDESLIKMAKEFWSFSQIDGAMPEEEAYKKAKANPNYLILSIGSEVSKSLKHDYTDNWEYRNISKGKFIGIFNGKKSPLIKNYIPCSEQNDNISAEVLAFGISSMQYLCKTMDEKNMKSNLKYKSAFQLRSPELKSKTLYLLDGWMDKSLTIQIVKKEYPYPVEIVDYVKWKDAILSKKENIVYCIVAPLPLGGDYVYQHNLVDAKTGTVYAIISPKMAVKINTGPFTPSLNLSKSNSGYINKKNIEMYKDATEGDW